MVLGMENPTRRPPRCVLCRTCVNFVSTRPLGERRSYPRACRVGVSTMPDLFACDSYVRRPEHPPAPARQ